MLTLRNRLSAGTLGELEQLEHRPAASAEDRWQRRSEVLFERLAVSWTVEGVEWTKQKEVLARFRVATPEEKAWVRDVLREHVAEWFPDVEAP